MPDLSQLEQIFNKVTPGKEVELYRAHVEWRKLKNQTVNDPAVVKANGGGSSHHGLGKTQSTAPLL